ncbi:MAG TPA: Dyp-type peroxidase [Candidatus Sulfotelmatobacter sp.]|nr:Dyp-type peroxidase [Candidatus Sulfotelmatobacter sp.]
MTPAVEWAEIQGPVLRAYAHAPQADYIWLRVTDRAAAKIWLSDLLPEITTAAAAKQATHVNLALTAAGMAALGLDGAVVASFGAAFFEGMDAPHRALLLGDVGLCAPERWAWGHQARTESLHLLLMLFAADEPALEALRLRHEQGFAAAALVVVKGMPARAVIPAGGAEHFGFRDGVSQPVIAGSHQATRYKGAYRDGTVIAPGEFVLGYANELGQQAATPSVPAADDPHGILPALAGDPAGRRDLGRNGSFMVLRQLQQDVAGFWQYLAAEAARAGDPFGVGATLLAAKLIGRWPSGAPLAVSPLTDDARLAKTNDFGFALEDSAGLRCPVGAHIRRANPRDSIGASAKDATTLSRHHRLMRRGRSYGPRLMDPRQDDGAERGILFIALNANLERQFEFVQQTWLHNPKFGGLYTERDPLASIDDGAGPRSFTIPAATIRRRLAGMPRFVTVRGGAYLFLPGIATLRYLAAR